MNDRFKKGAPGATIVPDAPLTPEVYGLRGLDERWIDVPPRADVNAGFVPEAPRDGVVYGRRGNDGTWQRVEGGAVWIGPTPPANPVPGTLWWRNDPDGDLYILYDDGGGVQWVPAAKPGAGAGGGAFLPLTGGTLTGNLVIHNPTGSILIVDGAPTADATVRVSASALAALQLNTGADTVISMRLPGGEEFDLVTTGATNTFALQAGGVPTDIVFQVDHTQKIARFTAPPRTPVDPIDDDDLTRKNYVDNLLTPLLARIAQLEARLASLK